MKIARIYLSNLFSMIQEYTLPDGNNFVLSQKVKMLGNVPFAENVQSSVNILFNLKAWFLSDKRFDGKFF